MGHASQMIINEIRKWSLVTFRPHPFGGVEIRVNKKSMGHIHGENLADLPCYLNPTRIGRKTLAGSIFKGKRKGLAICESNNSNTYTSPPPSHKFRESEWICYYPRGIEGQVSH